MVYKDPGKIAQQRVDLLVTAVNTALKEHYKAAKTPPKEQIQIKVAHGKGAIARTPTEQAQYVLKKTSWTLNSSHMSDAAKHILVNVGGALRWDLDKVAKTDKKAWAVLQDAWNKSMNVNDIRNFRGEKKFAFPSADPLHMELPNSRLKDSDARVIEALEVYAKATRVEGKAKNLDFENLKGSKFQKDWLKAYDAKLAKAPKATK
jgi:hypothetical protein